MSSRLEVQRQENIRRNEAFLASLGLDTVVIPKIEQDQLLKQNTRRKKRARDVELEEPMEMSRRTSSRLKNPGVDPELVVLGVQEDQLQRLLDLKITRRKARELLIEFEGDIEKTLEWIQSNPILPAGRQLQEKISYDGDVSRNPISAPTLRKFIETLNASHSDEISNQAISHCCNRIHSMSNKALATRMKGISSGSGDGSREKLLVFYYALKMCGLEELTLAAAHCLRKWKIQVPEQQLQAR